MKVVWTLPAEEDRTNIVMFMAQDNPQAALELDNAFTNAGSSLAIFPLRAKIGRVPGTRELLVHKNYLLIYGIDEAADTVYIKAVLHTSRQYPPE